MFSKISLIKFVLVPLAAVTLLVPLVPASPSVALQERQNDPSPGPYYWPSPPTTNCQPDRTRMPLITMPDQDTVWYVGEWQQVRWQTQDDGSGQGNVDVDLSDLDVDVDTDLQADVADEDSSEDLAVRPGRLPRCVPRLVLYKRSDRFFNPITISVNFDMDEGVVDIFVPNVRPDSDYVVILYLGRMQSRGNMFQISRRRNQ